MSVSFFIQEGVGAPRSGGKVISKTATVASAPKTGVNASTPKVTAMQAPAGASKQAPAQGCGGDNPAFSFILLGAMFLLFYLFLIRPQQKRQKEHMNMINALVKGDMVVTSGGILGKIVSLTDKYVTLEVQDKVRIKFLRSSIQMKVSDESGSSVKSGRNGKSKKDKTKD